MQFSKKPSGDYVASAIGSQPEYRIVKGLIGWVAQAAVPNDMGGCVVGYIGTYKTLADAKKAANYAERVRLADDPNRDRKAYLRSEIDQAVSHVVADVKALTEAQARLDATTERLSRLKRELDGIEALEARADQEIGA